MRAGQREALFLALCFAAATLVSLLAREARERFSEFGFGAPPLLMLSVATVAGTAALWSLGRGGFFPRGRQGGGLRAAAVLATLLAAASILADLAGLLPRTPEIAWPDAWAFYPALAVIDESLLRLVPLALVFALVRRAGPAILGAALAGALLRTALVAGGLDTPWLIVAGQDLVFGLAGLYLLRRHGLIALFTLRLVYDLHWHILWGAARASLLFDAAA